MIGWPKAFNKAAKNIPLTRKWVLFFITLVEWFVSLAKRNTDGAGVFWKNFCRGPLSVVGCRLSRVRSQLSVVSVSSFASIRVIRGLNGVFSEFVQKQNCLPTCTWVE